MLRALVVDDHAVVRHGVTRILRDEFPDAHIGEGGSADEALQMARGEPWDIVVLDISMPGRSGLDALQDLRREKPALPVLMLSMYPEDQMATRVLKAGAAGYLAKDSAPDELVAAVRAIVRGGRYVSPAVAERLVLELQTADARPAHERLSQREFEILCMIGRGQTVTQIAEALTLSVKTVSTYRARILEKMQLRSNAELIHYAARNGLVG